MFFHGWGEYKSLSYSFIKFSTPSCLPLRSLGSKYSPQHPVLKHSHVHMYLVWSLPWVSDKCHILPKQQVNYSLHKTLLLTENVHQNRLRKSSCFVTTATSGRLVPQPRTQQWDRTAGSGCLQPKVMGTAHFVSSIQWIQSVNKQDSQLSSVDRSFLLRDKQRITHRTKFSFNASWTTFSMKYSLLRCSPVRSRWSWPMFQRCLHHQAWLHGATSQKTLYFILAAVIA
jgi:hypothetical protein